MDCFCDYDPPSIYSQQQVKAARKAHKCSECSRTIQPGEPYESTWGIWGGRADTFRTCQHCLSLREFVKAHVPCFCWAHGNTREDAIDTARGWDHEAPGLLFGAYRREIAIRRAKAAEKAQP